MNKRAYSIIVVLFSFVGIAFQHGQRPVGNEFVTVFLPGLLFLNSLQWIMLPRKLVWQATGFCISLAILLLLCVPYARSQTVHLANFVTFLLLFVVVESFLFWFLTPDDAARAISVSVNAATLYVALLGAFLSAHGIVNFGFSDGRFLLLAPLVGLSLYAVGNAFKWTMGIQLIFICTIVQIGLGLFDVGQANNIRWMSAGSVLAGFLALGFTLYWAKDWNK